MTFATQMDLRFDVAVLGAGINGTAAAQEISAAGYSLCLVDCDDIAAGASGRSSRMLHCGLRYFETPRPFRDVLRHPLRFIAALRMAKQAMAARSELVAEMPDRVHPVTMNFPLWPGGPVSALHLRLGMSLLRGMNLDGPALDFRLHAGAERRELPFFRVLRDHARITAIGTFREYLFDWPERMAVDAALSAKGVGATLLIRHSLLAAGRDGEHWWLELAGPAGETKRVRARAVLNLTGTWTDDTLARLAPEARVARRVRGTKGASLAIRLPAEFSGQALATLGSRGLPFYCLPSHEDVFYIGPTETAFDGDARDVAASREDVAILLEEAQRLLPGLGIGPHDVLFTWAGVRPLTHNPAQPMGARERRLHDHAADGLPGLWSMTGGPVMTHASAGRALRAAVARRLGPPCPAAREGRDTGAARAPLLSIRRQPTQPELREATRRALVDEHARELTDIIYRRIGLGWRGHLSHSDVAPIAEEAGRHLHWSSEAQVARVDAFLAHQSQVFAHHRPDSVGPVTTPARRAS